MATHKPSLYLLQVSSIFPEEGCREQHLQCQVKGYLTLAGLSRQFFDGKTLKLSVFIQSQIGSTWAVSTSCMPFSSAVT